MDLFTYLMKKKGRNSSVEGDLFSYLLANEGNGSYVNYTGETINVDNSVKARMKNWNLGGNTSQDETPTPTTPQDIHVVKGENNVIENIGKNLFYPYTFTQNNSGIEFITKDGYIEANGTAINNAYSMYSNDAQDKLLTLEAGTYCLSGASNVILLDAIRSNGQAIETTTPSKTYAVFTLFETTKIFIRARVLQGNEVDHAKVYPQLELGNAPTEYEKYKGKNYKVSLSSKNLLNYNNANFTSVENTWYFLNGQRGAYGSDIGNKTNIKTPVENGKTYTISFKTNVEVANAQLCYEDETLINNNLGKEVGSYKFTFTANRNGYVIMRVRQLIDLKVDITNIQIEEGSEATTYVPYMTPIELCKIGDYQDKIYKSNDKWYLEKNVGKYTAIESTGVWYLSGNNHCFKSLFENTPLNNIAPYNFDISLNIGGYCEILGQALPNDLYLGNKDNKFGISNTQSAGIYFRIYGIDTREQFIEWLNTNKPVIYYAYATPVITEITNEILLSQLNELAKAKSFNGQTNITQISEDLPFDLSVDIKTQ